MKKIYIIGIGLIGHSFARDLRKQYPNAQIFGINTTLSHITEALQIGLIDAEATIPTIKYADLVVLSIPVDRAIKVLPEILGHISNQTLVMDMGLTKPPIYACIATHKKRRNFLACHSIARAEFSGLMTAIERLYKEKTNFKLQGKGFAVFTFIGMRIRYMDPVFHDKHIA